MKQKFNIVIVGAGITGLSIAALLSQSAQSARMRLTLIDAAPRPERQKGDEVALRVSAIANGSAELLDNIGAWTHVRKTRASPYDRMRVWDEASAADGPATLRFDAAEFAVPQLGFIVENVLLQEALLKVLDSEEVELEFSTALQSLQRDNGHVRLRLGDARLLEADLVIGADGARSVVRDCVGIETQDWPYGQSALVTHLRPEESHRQTAWQRFLRDGPLGMLPLNDGRVSVVWSATAAQVEQAMAATDDDLGELITAASDAVLGRLTVAGSRGSFPLCARHARHYVMRNVALIGDAAHAVHPLAGQGANLGLQDATALAGVIESALENGEHPGDKPVLRRYERARKGANTTMLNAMTGLNSLFATDSAFVRALRTTGMQMFNHSGPIRERVVSVALGTRR